MRTENPLGALEYLKDVVGQLESFIQRREYATKLPTTIMSICLNMDTPYNDEYYLDPILCSVEINGVEMDGLIEDAYYGDDREVAVIRVARLFFDALIPFYDGFENLTNWENFRQGFVSNNTDPDSAYDHTQEFLENFFRHVKIPEPLWNHTIKFPLTSQDHEGGKRLLDRISQLNADIREAIFPQ